MDFTLEECQQMIDEAVVAYREACGKVEQANEIYKERKRIEDLKSSLGNISADDIARIQTLLTPASIESSEDVRIA